MKNEITQFNYGALRVRTVMIDGEPWFVAKDVAVALGYGDTVNAIKRHCRGVAKQHPIADRLGRMQNVRVIREPDIYRMVMGSNLESAEQFEEWVSQCGCFIDGSRLP